MAEIARGLGLLLTIGAAGEVVPLVGCLGLPIAGDSFLHVVGEKGRGVTLGVG